MRLNRIATYHLKVRLKTSLFVLLLVFASTQQGCRAPGIPSAAFIDRSGQVRISLKPGQAAHSFSEGLAAVSVDKKWGFIDTAGRFVIRPQFGWVGDFSDGLAAVTSTPESAYWSKTTLFGFIDKSGQYVIPERFNWVGSFTEGLAPVCVGRCRNEEFDQRHIGYIDHLGKYVVAPRFADAGNFSEELASASLPREFGSRAAHGFIDRSGKFVIEQRFRLAGRFLNGLAATDQGYVDHHGKVIIAREPIGEAGENFSEGWTIAQDGNELVFIDTTGQVQLRPHDEGLGAFSEGLAAACRSNCGPSEIGWGGNWGYIDRSGKFVIKPELRNKPEPFKNGFGLVYIDKR